MSDIISFSGKTRLLPPAASEFLGGASTEGCGMPADGARGSPIALAVVTFDPGDPSLNNATDEPRAQPAGQAGRDRWPTSCCRASAWPGSSLGVVLIVWGWQVGAVQSARPHWWLRLLLLPLACSSCSAVALAALPQPTSWPLVSGLGGATGDMMLEHAGRLAGPSRPRSCR